ncbi:ROK family transcriptional regulator [Streptomyces luteolus]|uniref:ROK family transcriptional regulator n=1 Tax=Streptomyces luteolus TaxID=3043615 RepID=A0ABT6T2D2_9ACTN|nr:ROK family transcriptional regulator [Streptomyces sp. B-S-A12]MDI3422023.1 ROK family transcriptional regulator [Streptomyces sp. B-S-A12]
MVERTSSASTRQIREANLRAVLHRMWDSEPVTGTDLIDSTGLTRATVHGVCEDLTRRGWIHEVENQREHGGYRMGRPARRYAFQPLAGVVVGVDCGQHRARATVTDLRGRTLARHGSSFSGPEHTPEERLDVLSRTILAALTAASVPPERVLVVVTGVPAPVDAGGRTAGSVNPFWEQMNPDIAGHLSREHGWRAIVDNDANLAAEAERWQGAGRGLDNFVTLLTGERIGAGIVDDGNLLRGARGGAGEMRFLDLIEGVGSAHGIARLARDWSQQAVRTDAHPESPLRDLAPEGIDAEAVFTAAEADDPLAVDVVERIGARFARIVGALAGLLDTERIVLAGAPARSCAPIRRVIERDLPQYVHPPLPEIVISDFGDEIVSVGAVWRALDHVREHVVEIDLVTGRQGAGVEAEVG